MYFDAIAKIVSERTGCEVADVKPESTFSELGIDSLDTVELLFGYFDVFIDGKAVAFRNKKSKELFALLVDRKGGFVTSDEAISFLWEDEPVNSVTLARYRKLRGFLL